MVEYYIGYIGIVVIHEMAHFFLLKIFHVEEIQITVGNFIYLPVGIFRISPFVLSGSVTFSDSDFGKLKLLPKLMIVMAGPAANILMGLVLSPWSWVLATLSYLMAVVSLLPIPFFKTDGGYIVKLLYEHLAPKKQAIHTPVPKK